MTQPCILYAVATILLSLTEAIRFKVQWGKVQNINHAVSWGLGTGAGIAVGLWWYFFNSIEFTWWWVLALLLMGIAFIFIRLTIFDPLLNLFRIWTGTNPTKKIDYVSTKTSSYEDRHSEKIGFWMKRTMGVAGFVAIFLLYKVIFKI